MTITTRLKDATPCQKAGVTGSGAKILKVLERRGEVALVRTGADTAEWVIMPPTKAQR